MKKILISGVSSGLGLALLDYFYNSNYELAAFARSGQKIEELKAKYPKAFLASIDVRDSNALMNFSDDLLKQNFIPEIVLNNAAIINANQKLWLIPAQDVDDLIDINIKGVINVIRAFLPQMLKQKSGTIVNFSSTWGSSVDEDVAPYCCSKWGIEGLSKSLALELPQGFACVALNPGIIDTPMLRKTFGKSAENYQSADSWAQNAAELILRISESDNGKTISMLR